MACSMLQSLFSRYSLTLEAVIHLMPCTIHQARVRQGLKVPSLPKPLALEQAGKEASNGVHWHKSLKLVVEVFYRGLRQLRRSLPYAAMWTNTLGSLTASLSICYQWRNRLLLA